MRQYSATTAIQGGVVTQVIGAVVDVQVSNASLFKQINKSLTSLFTCQLAFVVRWPTSTNLERVRSQGPSRLSKISA